MSGTLAHELDRCMKEIEVSTCLAHGACVGSWYFSTGRVATCDNAPQAKSLLYAVRGGIASSRSQ